MCDVHTSLMRDARAYAKSNAPWRTDVNRNLHGETSDGTKFGWRVFHYLAHGGISSFGRTVRQEERDIRQSRFLVFTGIFLVCWLIVLFI